MSLELSQETHDLLIDEQYRRKKNKIEPSAINKIAHELLNEKLVELKNQGK